MISIIVTSYTAERFGDLVDLLNSVRAQRVPIELVLVVEKDVELKENLADYLRENKFNHKLIFSQSRLGLANARNIGIDEASGEYVAFVDDDAVLSANWSDYVVEVLRRYPEAIGCTGPVRPMWLSDAGDWFPKSLYWIIGCTAWRDFDHERLVDHAPGVNMVFRRDAIAETRFTDKFTDGAGSRGKVGLVGDDLDFVIRLVSRTKSKLVYSPDIVVYHKVPQYKLGLPYIRNYAFWQAVAETRYNRLYGSKSRAESRKLFLRQLIEDLSHSPDIDSFARKIRAIAICSLFSMAGYLSIRFPRADRPLISTRS